MATKLEPSSGMLMDEILRLAPHLDRASVALLPRPSLIKLARMWRQAKTSPQVDSDDLYYAILRAVKSGRAHPSKIAVAVHQAIRQVLAEANVTVGLK
jgi:hypothetical protein